MKRSDPAARLAWKQRSRAQRIKFNLDNPKLELPSIEGFEAVEISRREVSLTPENATRESFVALLDWLPADQDLTFHDPSIPSPSDPGAYVSIQRNGEIGFACSYGNHGWYHERESRDAESLIVWMMRAQTCSPSGHWRLWLRRAPPIFIRQAEDFEFVGYK